MNSTLFLSEYPQITRSWKRRKGFLWLQADIIKVVAQQVPGNDQTGMTCLARIEISVNGRVTHAGCCMQDAPKSQKMLSHQVSRLAEQLEYVGTDLEKIMRKFCSLCPGPVSKWDPCFGKMPANAC